MMMDIMSDATITMTTLLCNSSQDGQDTLPTSSE